MSGLTTVGLFLVSLLFNMIILALWLRLALNYYRVSTLNPIYQMILTITTPLYMHKRPPPKSKYDWNTFSVIIGMECLKILSIGFLVFHTLMPIVYFILYVVADLIIQPCDILFYAILIRVIMSFANPHWQHPIAGILFILTEPLFKIGRRIVPNISGFDFSPFIILMILKVITLAIANSLPLRLL